MPPYVNGNSDFLKLFDPQHGGVTDTLSPRHAVFTTLDQRPYGGKAINNSVKEDNPKVDTSYTIPTLLIGGIVIAYLLTQNR